MAAMQEERMELGRFFLSWDCSSTEHDKLEEVCAGLDPSILALAEHGLDFIEMIVGSNQLRLAPSPLPKRQLDVTKLISACTEVDPLVFVLALQGLCGIEEYDDGLSAHSPVIKDLLRKWRCESPFQYKYESADNKGFMKRRVIQILKSLTIFKEFDVPLFIDNYGNKELLSNHLTEDIVDIDENTFIYHVTHQLEANQIWKEKCLKPSDNKNVIEGCWFGIDSELRIFGSRAFRTTLGRLGVQVLRQGEILSYKREVNVILYAGRSDHGQWDGTFSAEGLKKPIVDDDEYVFISIFVPSEFLPRTSSEFSKVFEGPFEVSHGPFCVKEKRNRGFKCHECQ